MKIVMRDGRVFQGTALQIVRAMQDIAWGKREERETACQIGQSRSAPATWTKFAPAPSAR